MYIQFIHIHLQLQMSSGEILLGEKSWFSLRSLRVYSSDDSCDDIHPWVRPHPWHQRGKNYQRPLLSSPARQQLAREKPGRNYKISAGEKIWRISQLSQESQQ